MVLLNGTGGSGSTISNALAGGSNPIDVAVNTANTFVNSIENSIGGTTNFGLPSSRIPSQQLGVPTRNIAHWLVPEVGIVNMYINPQSINYSFKKLYNRERTKGGYVIQYWGEELPTLAIRGHTGSSGVNGLNVLYEIYRAEQYLYDPIALSMAANNSISGLNDLVDSALGNLGGLGSSVTSSTSGIFNLDPMSQNILPRNIPSLASIALGIEFYYDGWVFRGYFESFSFTESAERIGIFDYDINFTVTQRRGYRVNSFGWQRSAIDGPSNNGTGGVPLSISGIQGF